MTNDLDKSIFPGLAGDRTKLVGDATCGCYSCLSEVKTPGTGLPVTMSVFIVCPDCGNKRCPKGTHHDNACTGSNDVCQPGSRYGGLEET